MKEKIIELLSNINVFLKKMFSISNFDNHTVIYILGIRIMKKNPQIYMDTKLEEFGLNSTKREQKIILSLTSFPDRINTVSKTISTLLRQTVKPDMVCLYLANEQFANKENDLPKELLDLKKYGLTIKWCNDTKSYKKLIPALKEFKNDIIITFDDDIYYPQNVVEILYKEYLKNKNCIYANRVRRFYIKDNELCSRTTADMYYRRYHDSSYLNKITGCGGVLYPPNSLNEEVFNEEMFKKIVPTQDDVWFWAMAVLNHTKIKQVASYDIQLVTVEDSQKYGLSKINKKQGKGIDSFQASKLIVKEYPKVFDILLEENNV